MSTEYKIADVSAGSLCALEHSSKLDLYLDTTNLVVDIARNLTPLQLAAIGVELIRVAGYQDEEKVDALLDNPRYRVEEEARRILGRQE